MLVALDANVVMQDPYFRNRKWVLASEAIAMGRLRVVLPEVARLEAVAGFGRHRAESIAAVRATIRKSSSGVKKAAEPLIAAYEQEIHNYEAALNARIRELGIDIADFPEQSHSEVARRAVDRVAPFDLKGGGYRDTLLWLSAIDQIDDPPFNDLVLVSDDGVFTSRRAELASELEGEVDAQLTVVRSVAGLDLPGEYEPGSFTLSELDISEARVAHLLRQDLTGVDVTRWTPPGPDHATVARVDGVHLLLETGRIRKRYAEDRYELEIEAVADVDARVLIIDQVDGEEVDFRTMFARWDALVHWRGELEGEEARLPRDGEIEVIGLRERGGYLHLTADSQSEPHS